MLLILGLVAGYGICFLWFYSLCKHAIRVAQEDSTLPTHVSNLIPFERGLELQQKTRAL